MALPVSPATRTENELAATYEQHYDLLVGIAVGRFGISPTDAETLAHEVFLQYLMNVARVNNTRSWLVGAIFNASKHHLRGSKRMEQMPEEGPDRADPRYARVSDVWTDQLAAREAIATLTPRCQLALRLRYFQEHTVPEIAEILGITKRYATKLIGRCLEMAQRRYAMRRQP